MINKKICGQKNLGLKTGTAIFYLPCLICAIGLKVEPSIQSAKTRPGADCGSDHELFIDKLRLILKKAGKNHYT